MAVTINKIRLINYRRFQNYCFEPNVNINVLVGDNESGKSTILEAIDLVANGSIRKVETLGLDRILNINAVKSYNNGARNFGNLPKLIVELYLDGNFDFSMNGNNNSEHRVCDGIRLVCQANSDYQREIMSAMHDNPDYFPYEYYSARFSTFADEGYSGYKKKIKSVLIDSANMNSDYATNDFVKRMYSQYTEDNAAERASHRSRYRQMREQFCTDVFTELNRRVPHNQDYSFGLKSLSHAGFENEMMIFENSIGIDNKGTGRQIFIKTDFALEHAGDNVDVILIEEPENHLSHVNLRKLVKRVSDTQTGQLFITTHNSLISTRLELKNLIILHNQNGTFPITLRNLSNETAKYFMKAPPASIIEFALSDKVILLEGPSEYIIFEKLYTAITGNTPEQDNVHIMDIHGLSFKRYLDIAVLLGNKVAVITDNDKDYQKNCIDKYVDFANKDNIEIFYENNNEYRTFEIVLFHANTELCNRLFGAEALKNMLSNKTESAFRLLSDGSTITVPQYIKEAIEWIRE